MVNAELLNRKDALTGFHTKEGLNEYLASKITAVYERVANLSVILLDLDNFKGINDKYGHLAGDDALRYFSGIINKVLKGRFFVGRYGGDEFVIVMQDSLDGRESLEVANKIRATLVKEKFNTASGPLRIKASFGIATYPDDEKTPRGLLEMADQALYYAKKHGRNRIIRSRTIGARSVKDRMVGAAKGLVVILIILAVLFSFKETSSLKGIVDDVQDIVNYASYQLHQRKARYNYCTFRLTSGKFIEGWLIREDKEMYFVGMKKPMLHLNPFVSNRSAFVQPVKIPKEMVFSSIKSLRK